MFLLLAQFEFESPARLFWLALLPLIWFASWRSRATLPGAAWWLAAGCRMLLVAALIVALAGPRAFGPSRQKFVVLATDVSRSAGAPFTPETRAWLDAIEQAGRGHRIAFLPFAGRVGQLGDKPAAEAADLDPAASDPGEALRIATALIPGDFVPQVVLLTDGRENRGQLARAAYSVNLPVHVQPLTAFPQPEVCLAGLSTQASVARGMEIPVTVRVRCNRFAGGRLTVLANGEEVQRRDVALADGESRFEVRVPPPTADRVTLEARVEMVGDSIPENNIRRGEVAVRGGYRVLLVAADNEGLPGFRELLQRQGFEVTWTTPDAWQPSGDGWESCDVCILSGVSPREIATRGPDLERFVRDGAGGLIVVGGEATFAWQALQGTALEPLLPVRAVQGGKPPRDALAMVLVIDRSSSMQQEQRMALAKQAAKQSIEVLSESDQVGVIAFSDSPQWIIELAPCGDRTRIAERIETLDPYGQTQMYPAVERAFLALEQTDADRRHMILLTDGIPAPGDYLGLARRMAESGMTLSAITISPGAERGLLQRMAELASGRYHHCDDPADVPAILIEETQEAAGHEQPQRFQPFALRSLPGLDIAGAPDLQGYAATDLKPDAEPLLYAVGGSPLLSWRRVGSGISVALTTDVLDRQAAWTSWEGHGAFWKRLVRHAARSAERSPWEIQLVDRGDLTEIRIDALDAAGEYARDPRLRLRVERPNGTQADVPAVLTAPGRYVASVATPEAGRYEIRVLAGRSGGDAAVAGHVWYRDYPPELLLQPTDEALLRSVAATTGGEYAPEPADIFRDDGRSVQRITRYTRPLLLAALLLFLLDVAVRRLVLLRPSP